MEIKDMTTEEKYEYLIGMIEGCMWNDKDVVSTEKLLESLLIDLQIKYPVFDPVGSGVTFKEYIKLNEIFSTNNK